ncbi:hypothetical protein P8452_07752 [Trifolium repens]|nr:hypothetical protein P8452_07752 [Trifolium repens]
MEFLFEGFAFWFKEAHIKLEERQTETKHQHFSRAESEVFQSFFGVKETNYNKESFRAVKLTISLTMLNTCSFDVLNIQLITEKVNCIVLTRLKLSLLGSL